MGPPLDGSAEKASHGSLSRFADALDDRDDPDDAVADGAAPATNDASTVGASPEPASSVGPTSVDGQVTLEIVMPADAPSPGDEDSDPSYPQLCIPMDAADLDCHEMGVAGFDVLAPDRHKLDDDGDGLGCEP